MINTIEQRPTPPKEWLTYLAKGDDEHNRQFAKVISLPDTAPKWKEWLQSQYDEWQEKYNPQPETQEQEEV